MADKSQEGKNKRSLFSKILRILKWIGIILILFICISLSILFVARIIARAISNKVPKGGINESMVIEINHSKQWINIYGQDINNPVILYLHGGPGSSTSTFDYKFLRKWSDIYTVVTWDQRDSGLSRNENEKEGKEDIPYTYDLFMNDGKEITKYLLDYLHKDKISLIGHSWGTYLGANLSLKFPEYYNYFIGAGQLVDAKQNEVAFVEAAKTWAKGDKEGEELVSKLDVSILDAEFMAIKDKIEKRYNYHALAESSDYNLIFVVLFNPYYSLGDTIKSLFSEDNTSDKYYGFINSSEFEHFSLFNRTEYEIPFYNINGDCDYTTNYEMAKEYFDQVKAPRKKFYTMENMTHGLMAVRSGEFSDLMHEIAKLEQTSSSTINSTITVDNANNATFTNTTIVLDGDDLSNNSTIIIKEDIFKNSTTVVF